VTRIRAPHLFILDTFGIVLAALFALMFRNPSAELAVALPLVLQLVVTRTIVDQRMGLYRHDWRFASVPDLARIAGAAAMGTLATFGAAWVVNLFYGRYLPVIPQPFWFIELLCTTVVLGGSRFAIRAVFDLSLQRRRELGAASRATLLFGAGQVGVMMARSARRTPEAGVIPVGFLDDDPQLAGTKVAGLRVFGGLSRMEDAVAATGARALLITMSNAPAGVVRKVVDEAGRLGLEVRTVPSVVELLDGSLDAYRVRQVNVEDLLRRPVATEHAAEVVDLLQDRVVLITGAGGSIGSELARQVHALRPRRLVLVDRAESPLFDIRRQLDESRPDDRVELRAYLTNVASRPAMRRLMEAERPDVILHAAAYKHVPMMEDYPAEAVHVNIGGTQAVLDAAAEAGVERFVLVSSDKAVRPSSVMGASKRVAEMLVSDAARRTGRRYVSVRFGNVLGSAGSVVPIFQEQLESGRPLTITHPEMTRYFMTIPEAVWLILEAAALAREGDLFVLDMGDPVRIVDLARDVVRLAGRDPETQPITYIGLRPGEKLHEELFYDEEQVEPTGTPKVLRAVGEPTPTDIRERVGHLMEYATGDADDGLRVELWAMVGGQTKPVVPAGEEPATELVPVPIYSGLGEELFGDDAYPFGEAAAV
jgi:FlaA1/EpsC-like NDP-sugar epimerase